MGDNIIRLDINNKGVEEFTFKYMLNVGFSGCNREAVQHHIDELKAMGVPAPNLLPTIYPISGSLAHTGDSIQVQHGMTSGEVEYVLLIVGGQIFITIGSDHSDRRLEQSSISSAKQACPNIIAPAAWEYEEVKEHWENIMLRSWVRQKGKWILYQEASAVEIMNPEELLELARDLVGSLAEGVVLFSGTIPTKSGMLFGDAFKMEMEDLITGRKLAHQYTIEVLPPARE